MVVVRGTHRVPGDKSITHRALMLATLAPGRSTIRGALPSLDARSTAGVLRALGAGISALRSGKVVQVMGRQELVAPRSTLQCGNSGTTARLMLGLLAAQPFQARLTGDASLRRRPMRRVTEPLVHMGAAVQAGRHDGLPLTIRGGPLQPLDWTLPVASAQIKSALLLAGAVAGVPVTLHEPAASRDHTERLLRHFGYPVRVLPGLIAMEPGGRITPFDMPVPGDPSSAAFLLAAAILADGGEIRIAGVGCNPSRLGYLAVLGRMGAPVGVEGVREPFGEPIGELVVRAGPLRAVTVPAAEVPGLIDEVPILACLAARAHGTSRFHGLAELRVKESDRLALVAENLRAIGVTAEVQGDDLVVEGTDALLQGRVRTAGDHRMAMAFMVLGHRSPGRIVVDDPGCAAVSYPGFPAALAALAAGVA